ncbi:MAG: hypothetical protein Q9182_002819 [Xanthomendoza sp. 2 TL-2023]
MDHAEGVQLHQKWPAMSLEQRVGCTAAIVQIVRQMAAIDFHVYGSLYFDSVDIDPALKHPIAPGYVVGPHCATPYWDCEAHEPKYYSSAKPNRGPWFDLAAYCAALIDVGMSRLPPANATANNKPSFHGAVAEHIRLLKFGGEVASKLIENPQVQRAAAPLLLHPDLHKRNIFVSERDPTTITGIIDWQSSSIDPAFMHANEMPDFAAHISTPDNTFTSEYLAAGEDAKRCKQAFIAGVRLLVPKLYAAWDLDDDIARFFEYCPRSYRDGAGILRQILMDLATRWKDLELPAPCPYPLPTTAEWLAHREEYKALEHAQQLKRFVMSRLNTASDGWVPADAWEETVEDHKKPYEEFLQMMEEEELRKVWPFDEPCSLKPRVEDVDEEAHSRLQSMKKNAKG